MAWRLRNRPKAAKRPGRGRSWAGTVDVDGVVIARAAAEARARLDPFGSETRARLLAIPALQTGLRVESSDRGNSWVACIPSGDCERRGVKALARQRGGACQKGLTEDQMGMGGKRHQ